MNYIKQLLYEMRHHKMMTWVSISGTAVSIFLVLVFFMVNSLSTVEVAPETKRHLIYGSNQVDSRVIAGDHEGWSASGGGTYDIVQKLYGGLEGVEMVSYTTFYPGSVDVVVEGHTPLSGMGTNVDGNFWKMYDFKFIAGRPFTEDEVLNVTTPPVVLSEKIARKIFGTADVINRDVNIGGSIYYVTGVVEDVNPILKNTWADVYLPLDNSVRGSLYDEAEFALIGSIKALLLYKEDADPESVRLQVKSRYATINSVLKDEQIELVYHDDTPVTPESLGSIKPWNTSQNVTKVASKQWLIYLLLILLPAINLSNMMRGRMQHRISEIGVRRAYGARKRDIVFQLLGENFIVTLAGGVIGLVLSYLFMVFLSSSFISMVNFWGANLEAKMATPSFNMLFTWQSFLLSLGACMVLNILTASVPAWRAASVEPAVAISKSKN